MEFLDFCSGIGGFRLGFERAGMKCIGFCEIDKFARQSYKAMFDTEGEWERHDVTAVTDEEIRELAKGRKIDIITGGFPCQSFSIAGKRRGFSDTRGTIFFEICRFIRIIRPRYFICENVKGLLSHDGGRTFGTILRTLAELGYCIEWQILNSKNYGVPQNRERVFIIGHLREKRGGKIFPVEGANGQNPRKLQEIPNGVADSYRIYNADGIARTLKSEGGGLGAKTGLYAVNVPFTIKKEKGHGSSQNLQIKRIGDETAATIAARYYKGLSADGCNGVICIQKTKGDTTTQETDPKGVKVRYTEDGFHLCRNDKRKSSIQGTHVTYPCGKSHCLNTGHVPMTIITENSAGEENTKNKASGIYTGVSGKYQRGPLEGLSRTLKSGKPDAGIFDGVRIRRLTPRECWRLQGFPDEYFDRAKEAGLSDTQLYKQAGNAVTVNVAECIGKKIMQIYG